MSYEILTPEIDMRLLPMDDLPPHVQGRICSCPARCKRYVELDVFGRYCEGAARNISLSLFSLVEGIGRIEPRSNGKRRWTMKEEQFIREWNKKYGGIRYGDPRIIAGMLGRPYNGVREKIKQMQRDGLI